MINVFWTVYRTRDKIPHRVSHFNLEFNHVLPECRHPHYVTGAAGSLTSWESPNTEHHRAPSIWIKFEYRGCCVLSFYRKNEEIVLKDISFPNIRYRVVSQLATSQESPISILTRQRAGRTGFISRQGHEFLSLRHCVQTESGAQPASSGCRAAWDMKLTTHLQLVPRFRMLQRGEEIVLKDISCLGIIYLVASQLSRSRDSSVNVVNMLRARDRSWIPYWAGIFLFATASISALGLTQPPIQWVPEVLQG